MDDFARAEAVAAQRKQMMINIANENMSPSHLSKTAANPDPTIIPETESGNVLKRAAFNQAFIFMRFCVYKLVLWNKVHRT